MRITTMSRITSALMLLLFAAVVHAQTGAPTAYLLRAYATTAPTVPVSTTTFPVSAALCNLAPEAGVDNVVNPRRAGFDDRVNQGRMCTLDTTAAMTALADGTYTWRVSASNVDGEGGESNHSNPFVRRRPNPPAAQTGARALP